MILPLAGLLLVAGAQAAAPAQADPSCRDDNGVDRCAEEQQRRMRGLYGVRSIEEHRDAGDQVRRVFYVDGYGRDVILIAFVRSPGRDPTVWIHFPQREGQPPPEPLSALVPKAVWDEVLFRSALFDRELVSSPPDPNVISICMHSWVYVIEATDPSRGRNLPATIRRKTEDACANGVGELFASDVQRTTLPLFAHCNALDPSLHRNPASQLAACRLLHGDRMAAAEVMNQFEGFWRFRRADDAHQIRNLFDMRVAFDGNGERFQADSYSGDEVWAARMRAEGYPRLYSRSFEGIDARRVRFRGSLLRTVEQPGDTPDRHEQASIEMIWVFTPTQEFQVENVAVGPWETVRPS